MWSELARYPLVWLLVIGLHLAAIAALAVGLATPDKSEPKPAAGSKPVAAVALDYASFDERYLAPVREQAAQQAAEAKRRRAAEAARKAAAEKERREAEAARQAAEEKRRREAEAARQIAKEKQRREAEAARRAAEEKRQQEAEAARQAAAEQQRREAEAARKAEAEKERREAEVAQQQAAAAAQQAAEEKQRQEAATARQHREAEAARRAEEEKQLQQAARQEAARLAEQRRARAQARAVDAYKNTIKAAVQRNWIKPPNLDERAYCTVHVTQTPGGFISQVEVLDCRGGQAFRRSVEAAVWKAEPLPQPNNPEVFERKIEFEF